jgi:hypothetical protein
VAGAPRDAGAQIGAIQAAPPTGRAARQRVKVTASRRRIALRLSEAGDVTFRVERATGRRVGRPFAVRLGAGAASARLPRLARGRYRLVAVARDAAGNAGGPVRVAFRR